MFADVCPPCSTSNRRGWGRRSGFIVPVVVLVVIVALRLVADLVAIAPAATTSAPAAAPATPPATSATPASARHRPHQAVEHARHLVAAVGEVVVVDFVFEVAAQDQHVPQGLE